MKRTTFICSRCWRQSVRGLQITLRSEGNESVMASYNVCENCAWGGPYGRTWRTFAEVIPLAEALPWEYRLSIVPWHQEEE